MKLQRICFNNFGIIRDQIMEDIHPGLVIIAGLNRAGKTTLMTALRYLGYGLPKRNFIPFPLVGQHDYNADLELEDHRRYNIHILGNSKPKVSPLGSSRDTDVEEIFNNLDGFTYRQVFTISLDELRQVPEGLDTKDGRRLPVVLLGGGWVDALHLAKFAGEFDKKAKDIGRTKGAKDVGEFKVYWETIKEGIAERNEVNKQLEFYYEKLDKLAELENKIIPQIEKELINLQAKLDILEIVKDHYSKYEKILLIGGKLKQNNHLLISYPGDSLNQGIQLKEKYNNCVDEYEKSFRNFTVATGTNSPGVFLEKKDVLFNHEKNLSGWKEKIASYREKKQEYFGEEENLKQKLGQLNIKWGDDLSILNNIITDFINKENLRKDVEEYKKTADRIEQIFLIKKQAQNSMDAKQEDKKQFIEKNNIRPRKNLPVIAGLGLALTLLTAILNPIASLAVGFVLAVAIYVHFQSHQLKEKDFNDRLKFFEKEIKDLKDQLASLATEEGILQDGLAKTKDKLDQTVEALNLPSITPYSQLMDFYGEIINLKERYNLWLKNKKKLRTQREELEKIFNEISSVLNFLNQAIPDIDANFSSSTEIFTIIERSVENLLLARKFEEAEADKKGLEKKIIALLQKENPNVQIPPGILSTELSEMLDSFITRGNHYQELKKEEEIYENLRLDLETSLNIERRKKILLENKPAKNVLLAYDKYFNAYSSLVEIEAKCNKLAGDIEELRLQREYKLQDKAVLEREIQDLSSDEKLQAIHQKITRAKNKLEDLAEQYAIYRLAEFMVTEAYRIFIEGTKGSILNSASKIFKEITSGDYERVTIPGTSVERSDSILDFKVKQVGGRDHMSLYQLSRATKEQLFLSVRLSRICNMKPLPIIFDDSLVNFDPNHSKQAARLIAEIAKTHQIFVLTCHPRFISYLQNYAESVQYWGLDNGKINGPFDTFNKVTDLLNP